MGARELGYGTPIELMFVHESELGPVEATRLGAYDFLEKPLSLAKLLLTAERALEAQRLAQENVGLRRRAANLFEPVGNSQAMQQLFARMEKIVNTDSTVLVLGASGTGKDSAGSSSRRRQTRSTAWAHGSTPVVSTPRSCST